MAVDFADYLLSSYMFDLPEDQIAQNPPVERGTSRLLVLERGGGVVHDGNFQDILSCLPENCLLVANNSRVIPARVYGARASGGKVEFLLLTPLPLVISVASAPLDLFQPHEHSAETPWVSAEVKGLLRSSKQVKAGERIRFAENFFLELLERGEFGHCTVRLIWTGDLHELFIRHGELPLPPYIRRPGGNAQGVWGSDAERYQTTYACKDKAGSVAAPTAGLHFTPELKEALVRSGREWAEVTLYVGYGTFSPVRCNDIREHPMHEEYVELSGATVAAIHKAKKEGRAIIAVGTTSARVLEGVAAFLKAEAIMPDAALHHAQHHHMQDGEGQVSRHGEASYAVTGVVAEGLIPSTAQGILRADLSTCSANTLFLKEFYGHVNIFLYPGKPLRVIDGLITNFHLPGSSLLMLVSALAGRSRILDAYQYAIDHDFRFFSYGDAMLIRP